MAKSHLTKREAQAVCDYAVDVCEALSMEQWRITVLEEPCEDDAVATIDTVYGKHVAQLSLCSDWMQRTSAERRETITHEVLHLLHERVNHVFDDAQALMHDHEHRTLSIRYRRETELMVDHLAVFLANTHTLEQAWDTAHQRRAKG